MVSKTKREELAKVIMELSKTSWFESICHDDDEKALILVDEITKAGWVPIEDFPDEEYPAPTQAVVNDVMERIISGLPARVLTPVNPEGTATYTKPQIVNEAHTWVQIPDFDNYEINKLGDIRSRWTKRKLDVSVDGDVEYVDMHDKEGFGHIVNVRYIMEKVFGA